MKIFGIILLFGLCSVSSGMTFSDGGYDNVLVAFNEQIKQPRDCSDVLDNLESSFYNLSSSLYRASGSRAYIRSVTVLLPRSWNLVACSRRSDGRGRYYGETYSDADFRVVPTHRVLLDSVWTQQSKACGEEGDYVNVPYSFFSGKAESKERYGDLGKTLLHEWAKYRYGVFDEFGFPNDPLYPAWHRDNGQVSHTGCSNIPVVGSIFGCDPTKDDCQFRPSPTNNSDVKTSLMYMHFLPNVTDFCDANSHKDGPPTKHNILCKGRSTKEVILEHRDFGTSFQFQPVFANVSIIYKQPKSGRFVIALDTSSGMNEKDKWKYVRIALRRFLLRDMPNGTEVGMVSFSSRAEALTNVTVQLSSETVREQVISGIPDILDLKPDKCFRCAVEESIKVFEAGSSASPGGSSALGQTIIVITNGLGKSDVKSALELARSKKVKLSIISYAGKSEDVDLPDVTAETGGLLSVVPEEMAGSTVHLSMLIKLGDSLLEVLNYHQLDGSPEAASTPVLVHEAEFRGPSSRKTVNGTFSIDSTLGETTFSVYFSSRDSPGVKNLRLIAPDGTVRVGQSEEPMASLYFSPVNPIAIPGTWSYSFEQDATEFQSHFVKVTSRRKPFTSALTAQLRFSNDTQVSGERAAPTIIYAEVKMGDMPVIDAAAFVSISYQAENRTKEYYLQLLDNGKGDPDITAKDGIYSRYFVPPAGGKREYTFTLYVSDNSGKAYTVKASAQRVKRAITVEPETSVCCGSIINIPQESREYIGAFQRTSRAPPKTVDASGSDYFPPSRITDLRASVIGQTVYLTWSAPGGDYDSGKASAYELRYARSSSDLRTRFSSTSSIDIYEIPLAYESPSAFNFTFTNYDVVYYFAIRALDGDDNKGDISNVVSVFVVSPPTTTTTTVVPPTVAPSREVQGLSLAAILGIAAGAFLALVLIVLACCLAIYKRKRRTKDPKYQSSNLYQTKPTGIVNTSMKEPEKLLRAGNDDSDGKSLSVIYEASLPANPPVHWSASQLLAEHERRQSPYVGQQNYHYETNNNPNVQSYYPGLPPENNGSVYNGYYHNAPTLPYPTHNERYSPYGRGSSPPSDSVHSGNSDGRMLPNEYDTSVEYSQNSVKVPPPTLPKPVRAVPPQQPPVLQGSFTSLVSDRKKRNITQV